MMSAISQVSSYHNELLRTLTGGVSSEFLSNYFLRFPFAMPELARPWIHLLDTSAFGRMSYVMDEKEVMIVKDGRLRSLLTPRNQKEIEALWASGHSIIFRQTQKFDPKMALLGQEFEAALPGVAAIQLYSTPAGHHSFGWHYDAEEVFIIQTEGEKKYFLRQNTVNPRPDIRRMPRDMHYEQETSPYMSCTMIAGDWLYIPAGWWHVAQAVSHSLSISIGMVLEKKWPNGLY